MIMFMQQPEVEQAKILRVEQIKFASSIVLMHHPQQAYEIFVML